MARYDKYDGESGGFRAPLAANLSLTNQGIGPVGVGLDTNGRVVLGAGANTGIVGVMVKNMPAQAVAGSASLTGVVAPGAQAGDIVDIMTDGEIVDVTGLVAGTTYYADTTTGALGSSGGAGKVRVGHTVEATRLVIRMDRGADIATTNVVGDQAAIADISTADGSDAATTQALANATKAKVNTLLAELRTGGFLLP